MLLRKGVKLLEEIKGGGKAVRRRRSYLLAIRIRLNRGELVIAPEKCLSYAVDEHLQVHDDGYIVHRVRIDREHLIAGIFYAVEGMNVGGYRQVEIGPHLAYGEVGVPGTIPKNAKIIAEIKVIRPINDRSFSP